MIVTISTFLLLNTTFTKIVTKIMKGDRNCCKKESCGVGEGDCDKNRNHCKKGLRLHLFAFFVSLSDI